MTAAIETQQLTRRFRSTAALSDVTLQVPAGATYALVGANGAGKTTLIKLLMNILPASSGQATVLGVDSTQVAGTVFERIAYVSENQELPESMTVKAFLAYVRSFYPQWDRALEQQLVRQFALPLDRKLKALSRGMKMKAALVSVLAYRPSLIVLDEPFSGLDPLVRDEFIQSLVERSGQTTILLSSHDLSEIESFATHVGYLESGRLLFSEEMTALAARFREIEVVLGEGGDPAHATAASLEGLPPTWLQVQRQGNVLRFVDSQFVETTTAALAERFGAASRISVTSMPLRAMFLAIARAGRLDAEQVNGGGAI
jgi:ABC-2 type transport system ATP-binding protein